MAKKGGLGILIAAGVGLFFVLGSKKKANASPAHALPGPDAVHDDDDDDDDDNPSGMLPQIPTMSQGLPQPWAQPPQGAPQPSLQDSMNVLSQNLPQVLQNPGGVNLPSIPVSYTPGPPAPQQPAAQPPNSGVSLPSLLPPVQGGETPIMPAQSASQPTHVDDLTHLLLAQLLAAEGTKGWKKKYPVVGQWQAMRKLTVDNMFGPKSALKLAEEVGTLPLIRYWPKGSQPGPAVNAFRDAIEAMAATAQEPRHSQLLAAAVREQGQGFAASPIVPATLIAV